MDLIVSYIVMIIKGFLDCIKNENFIKIDITFFLENLKYYVVKLRIKKDLVCFIVFLS